MSLPVTDGLGLPAVHDPDGFAGWDMHGAYDCILCTYEATVLDVEFLCDYHWLYCDVCGTGIFKGIEWAGCPKCLGIPND